MKHSLELSIIVVNWKVRDLLRDCLHSLYDQMLLPKEAWEVIVVDNNSEDGSVQMVRHEFPTAIVLANSQNLGFGKAVNQAFRESHGSHVLLLNPDTVLMDHTVDRMLEIMHSRCDAAVIGCRLLNTDGSFQRWTGGYPPNLLNTICHFLLPYWLLPASIFPFPLCLQKEPEQDLDVGWISGACMLLRKEPLGETVFDERFFMYGEDIELCGRLGRAGWKIIYTPKARITHFGGRSTDRQSPEIQLSRLRNLRSVFAMRHNPVAVMVFDLVVSSGFLVRFLAFRLAATTRPRSGFENRAASARLYLTEAVRLLVHGREA